MVLHCASSVLESVQSASCASVVYESSGLYSPVHVCISATGGIFSDFPWASCIVECDFLGVR